MQHTLRADSHASRRAECHNSSGCHIIQDSVGCITLMRMLSSDETAPVCFDNPKPLAHAQGSNKPKSLLKHT